MLPEAEMTTQARKKPGPEGPRHDRQIKKAETKGKLSARRLAEKNDVSMKTIDRWEALGIIPRGKRIRGRRYWDEDTEPLTDAPAAEAIT